VHVRRDVQGRPSASRVPKATTTSVPTYCSKKDRPVPPGCVCQELCGGDDGPSAPPLAGGRRASAAAGEASDDDDSGMAGDENSERIVHAGELGLDKRHGAN
jgi:hypothetical protein